MAERFRLPQLAVDATVALIDTIQLYPPQSDYCTWSMKNLERYYIEAHRKSNGFGLRYAMVHFLSIYFRYTTRNRSSLALLNTAFESECFRWGPIVNLQSNHCGAIEALSEARNVVCKHLLPLIFKRPGVQLANETALLLSTECLKSDNKGSAQQLQEITDGIRGYLKIVPI